MMALEGKLSLSYNESTNSIDLVMTRDDFFAVQADLAKKGYNLVLEEQANSAVNSYSATTNGGGNQRKNMVWTGLNTLNVGVSFPVNLISSIGSLLKDSQVQQIFKNTGAITVGVGGLLAIGQAMSGEISYKDAAAQFALNVGTGYLGNMAISAAAATGNPYLIGAVGVAMLVETIVLSGASLSGEPSDEFLDSVKDFLNNNLFLSPEEFDAAQAAALSAW